MTTTMIHDLPEAGLIDVEARQAELVRRGLMHDSNAIATSEPPTSAPEPEPKQRKTRSLAAAAALLQSKPEALDVSDGKVVSRQAGGPSVTLADVARALAACAGETGQCTLANVINGQIISELEAKIARLQKPN